jgi:hypothetical protein
MRGMLSEIPPGGHSGLPSLGDIRQVAISAMKPFIMLIPIEIKGHGPVSALFLTPARRGHIISLVRGY